MTELHLMKEAYMCIHILDLRISNKKEKYFGLGGLGVTWGRWIFSERKNPEHKSSERDFKLGVPSLRFQAR